jgi:hypothetical protein
MMHTCAGAACVGSRFKNSPWMRSDVGMQAGRKAKEWLASEGMAGVPILPDLFRGSVIDDLVRVLRRTVDKVERHRVLLRQCLCQRPPSARSQAIPGKVERCKGVVEAQRICQRPPSALSQAILALRNVRVLLRRRASASARPPPSPRLLNTLSDETSMDTRDARAHTHIHTCTKLMFPGQTTHRDVKRME